MKPKLVGDETETFSKKSLARYHYPAKISSPGVSS
jgi:hypothetical protein